MNVAPRIVIVGAEGLLGSAVVDAATRDGVLALAPGRSVLDVNDTRAVVRSAKDHGATHIVFAAAKPWVEGCEHDPATTRRINVDAPTAVARACEADGIVVVGFSTEYVFAGGTDSPYTESDSPSPINEYGRQKLDLERALTDNHLVLRVSGLYGPEPRRKNFVLAMWDAISRGERVKVPSDQHITPTFTPSLAELIVECCTRGLRGLLHLAGPVVVDRVEFARLACRANHIDDAAIKTALDPVPTAALGLKAPRPLRAGLSVDRARQLLTGAMVAPVEGLRTLALSEAT